jgi:hypothetical protein
MCYTLCCECRHRWHAQLLSGSKKRMAASAGVYDELVASDVRVDGPIEEDIPRTM